MHRKSKIEITLLCLSAAVFTAAVLASDGRIAPRPWEQQAISDDSAAGGLTPDQAALQTRRQAAFDAFRRQKLALAERAPETTLVAAGDIMLSRTVAAKMSAAGSYDLPFLKTADWLRSGQAAFGNLETAVTPGRAVLPGEMMFRADTATAAALKRAGFTVLSLANNHTPNFGQSGLRDTFKYLSDAGLLLAGAGKDEAAARAPALFQAGGRRFAVLAYNDSDVVPASYAASADRAGTAFMDIDRLRADLAAVRPTADVVIVSMHSGSEYTPRPNARQTAFAHAAIDAGADLVIGHHPHVVQTAEIYGGKPILYSLGNFVFDQDWSRETRDGLGARIVFDGNEVGRIELLPLTIENSCQPTPAAGDDSRRILGRLGLAPASRAAYAWSPTSADLEAIAAPMIYVREPAARATKLAKRLDLDIDGDGQAETFALKDGVLDMTGGAAGWRSPDSWWVDNFAVADVNGDGDPELAMSAWRAGSFGESKPFWAEDDAEVRNHFFVFSLKDGRVGSLWQSSALERPNCEFVFADIDGDGRQELVVNEGDYGPGAACRGRSLAVWRWSDWGFANAWRGPDGSFSGLTAGSAGGRAYFAADRLDAAL